MSTKFIGNNLPKPYVVLTTVQSESGSWEYEIRTSLRDGKTYCSCKGFAFHKNCKHMDAYRKAPTISTPAPVALQSATPRTPGEILRHELQALGLAISVSSANAISSRVLAAAGKSASTSGALSADTVNAAGVRVIVLPD
jgi:hypothetical protein